MTEQPKCRTCGGELIRRETKRKASQLKQVYYYTAYYFCPNCQKIYHDDKFKVINELSASLFDKEMDSRLRGNDPPSLKLRRGKQERYDVEIWTDGACVFNGRHNARAAWAFVSHSTSFLRQDSGQAGQAGKIEKAGLVPGAKQTNNVAEGLAILRALEWAVANNYKKIKIYSDSQITINNFKKPAYQIKQNREIFQKIEGVIKQNKLTVYFEKVLGHSGDVNNTRADKLANQLAGKHL